MGDGVATDLGIAAGLGRIDVATVRITARADTALCRTALPGTGFLNGDCRPAGLVAQGSAAGSRTEDGVVGRAECCRVGLGDELTGDASRGAADNRAAGVSAVDIVATGTKAA